MAAASCYLESWGGYQQSVSVPMVDDGGLLQKIGCASKDWLWDVFSGGGVDGDVQSDLLVDQDFVDLGVDGFCIEL